MFFVPAAGTQAGEGGTDLVRAGPISVNQKIVKLVFKIGQPKNRKTGKADQQIGKLVFKIGSTKIGS